MTPIDQTNDINTFSDDPISDFNLESDMLGRQHFAESIAKILHKAQRSHTSTVIGLSGPWGCGKTSLLNQVKIVLSHNYSPPNKEWIDIEFNPWFFQDISELQIAFFGEISSSIPAGRTGRKIKKALSGFGLKVAPLGALAPLIGLANPQGALESLSKLLNPEKGITKSFKDLEKQLTNFGRPLLIIIDDLDRLAPDELLLTLKLVRLIGRLPKVYYILAYDENTLLDCLSRTGLVGDEPRRGLEYLEKIVQIRLDVPPIRDDQSRKWIDKLLTDLQKQYSLLLTEDQVHRFKEFYTDNLRHRLNTPRAIKRYFSQVDSLLSSIHEEVDFVDFAILTWIRTAEPLVYNMLTIEGSSLLRGYRNRHFSLFPEEASSDEVYAYWRDRLEQSEVTPENIESVAAVIGSLFPRFKSDWARSQATQNEDLPYFRIQNPNYFDRYFSFGVPEEDIPDQIAISALEQIVTQSRGSARTALEERIEADPSILVLALGKMKREFPHLNAHGIELAIWIQRHLPIIPEENSLLPLKTQVIGYIEGIYCILPADSLVQAIDRIADGPEGLMVCSLAIRFADMNDDFQRDADRLQEHDKAKERLRFHLKHEFEKHRQRPISEIPQEVWSLLWPWQDLAQQDAHQWANQRIDDDTSALQEMLSRMIPAHSLTGTPRSVRRLEALNLDFIDSLVGLDKIFDILDAELSSILPTMPLGYKLEDTNENRFQIALRNLKDARDKQK